MTGKIILVAIFSAFLLAITAKVFAVDCNNPAVRNNPANKVECAFGTISPPPALQDFLKKDPTGAGAISQFLSNFVVLIFSVAGIVLILMILWGAFDWMISEGEKEKVASARNKIIHAILGILLFAVAFAIIRLLGQFTGFSFFKGQNPPFKYIQDAKGIITGVDCLNGTELYSQQAIFNPAVECEKSKGK